MTASHAASVLGTPEFMAPEFYEENYGTSVDIYAFGMSLIQMLIGETPYRECDNPAQIYKKVTDGQKPKALTKIRDPEIVDFLNLCLYPEDGKRPTAGQLLDHPFLDDLENIKNKKPILEMTKHPVDNRQKRGTTKDIPRLEVDGSPLLREPLPKVRSPIQYRPTGRGDLQPESEVVVSAPPTSAEEKSEEPKRGHLRRSYTSLDTEPEPKEEVQDQEYFNHQPTISPPHTRIPPRELPVSRENQEVFAVPQVTRPETVVPSMPPPSAAPTPVKEAVFEGITFEISDRLHLISMGLESDGKIQMKLLFNRDQTEICFPFFLGGDTPEQVLNELSQFVKLGDDELPRILKCFQTEEKRGKGFMQQVEKELRQQERQAILD